MASTPWDTPEFKKWWAGGGQQSWQNSQPGQGGAPSALIHQTPSQQAGTFSGMGYGGGYGGSVGDQQAAAAAYQPQQFAGPNSAAKQQAAQAAWQQQQQAAQQPMPGVAPGGGGGGNGQYTGFWGDAIRDMDANPNWRWKTKGSDTLLTREDLIARAQKNPNARSKKPRPEGGWHANLKGGTGQPSAWTGRDGAGRAANPWTGRDGAGRAADPWTGRNQVYG